jgi:hypothetical protein
LSVTNHTVYGDLDGGRFVVVNFELRVAAARHQAGMPQDTNDWNFVTKRDLTR